MIKLSVIILAKNAENLIVDCIESVRFADEILVIDDNSEDRTAEIAKKLGAKVIEESTKSFAEKRNVGLKHATGEWILYIDTDERVSGELSGSIKNVILGSEATPESKKERSWSVPRFSRKQAPFGPLQDDSCVAYKIQRQNFYLGNHPWPKIEQLERLFKKSALKGWYGELHESPKVDGKVGLLDGFLLHYTHRDLSSMLEKTIEWSDKEARLRFDTHHPQMTWWRFPRVMLTAFWDSYIKQQGYKAGTMGVIESVYQAFSMFVTYAKLWEMQQERG